MDLSPQTKHDSNQEDGNNHRGIGLTSGVLPAKETSLQTDSHQGVSTHCVPPASHSSESMYIPTSHWFVLRATYGRERQAYEYMKAHHITVFHPTRTVYRKVEGKVKAFEESYIPNLLFAYGPTEVIESFVYDNNHLPYLRFYCRCFWNKGLYERKPIIIPDKQMKDFISISNQATEQDIIITTGTVKQLAKGQPVRILQGPFKGVEGFIFRYKHQQRVAVVIKGVATAITAYVPTAYVEPLPATR